MPSDYIHKYRGFHQNGQATTTTLKSNIFGQFLRSWICSPLKKYLSDTFAWAFAPIMLTIGLPPRLRMSLSFLEYLYPELLSASAGAQLRKSHSALFDPTTVGQIPLQQSSIESKNVISDVFDPIGGCNRIWTSWIEKVQTVVPCNWAPGEAGNSSGYRYSRKLPHILRRGGRPISSIIGANAHANERTERYLFNELKSSCKIMACRSLCGTLFFEVANTYFYAFKLVFAP